MVLGEVLLPYKITLLSNAISLTAIPIAVLLPYEITLLSNLSLKMLTIIQFYYLMKLHYSQTTLWKSTAKQRFTTL